MSPTTSAAPSPRLRPVSVYPRQDKGKGRQLTEWPPGNEVSALLTSDAELSSEGWERVEENFGQIESFSLENGGSSSTHFPGGVNALFSQAERAIRSRNSSQFLHGCGEGLAEIHEKRAKQADLPASLERLKNICITQLAAIEELEKNHRIDLVTQLGLESEQELRDSRLQERFATAKQLLSAVHQVVDGLLQDPNPEEQLHELDAYIKDIIGEVAVLEKGLPSPAKTFLWVVGVAVILVPIVTVLWYILGSLGVFAMGAAMPQAIAALGWIALVFVGILNKWPDFKNACAERASESPQKLIQSHKTVLTVHEEMRSNMSQADIAATRKMAYGNALVSALGTDATFRLSANLDQVSKDVKEDTADIKQKLDIQNSLLKQLAAFLPERSRKTSAGSATLVDSRPVSPELIAAKEQIAKQEAELAAEREARIKLERQNARLEAQLEMYQKSNNINNMG